MSKLSDARSRLAASLSTAFVSPVNGITFRGRVEAYPPAQPVAPTVWVEQPLGGEAVVGERGTVLIDVATFPVAIVYDGADRAQVAGLDEVVARVWDLARAVGHPVRFEPRPLDVGGPNLRATYVDVEMTIAALTLCSPPELSEEVA